MILTKDEVFPSQFSSVTQSCPTLCDPIDGSPPGSPVPGILQARTLEWVPFPSPSSPPTRNLSRYQGLFQWVSSPNRWPKYWSFSFNTSPSKESVQFSSVAQSCPTLCNPMNRSTPGLPVHHQLPEFTQTHVHRVGDAIQPSHPLSSPSPPAPNPSQHQSLFQ